MMSYQEVMPAPSSLKIMLDYATKWLHNHFMDDASDLVFKALADSSRRELLDRLRLKNGQTLGELCEGHAMSRQAVTKHLAILESANLVVTVKQGREKFHYLNPVPIHEIYTRWIGRFEEGRMQALGNLKEALQTKEKEGQKP